MRLPAVVLVLQLDAFVVVWAFCCAGVTFQFSKHLPILGYGVRALQNLYVPEDKDRTQQQKGMVQLIKERWAAAGTAAASCMRGTAVHLGVPGDVTDKMLEGFAAQQRFRPAAAADTSPQERMPTSSSFQPGYLQHTLTALQSG